MQAMILNILMSLLTLFSFTIESSHATATSGGGIAIYWGQYYFEGTEGTLTSACDSGNYEIVNLAFLTHFGCGKTPQWNFAGYCGSWSPCTKLESEIQHCQQKGIKVFLSLGGASAQGSLCSPQDAKQVANYLYNNFLNGQYGPLGSVTMDGIDFDIEGVSNLYWDNLASELDALRKQNNRYFYLSATPQCVIPDYCLDKAIKTGLFDYIFVQFYNNRDCQYDSTSGDVTGLLKSWDAWTSLVMPNNTVFMGLPASVDAAPSGGYIPSNVVIAEVLPHIKQASNYGGIMLWDRYRDVMNGHYSDQIKDYVPKLKDALRFVTGISNAISECVSAALHRILPKQY